jgi:hypothetical protein
VVLENNTYYLFGSTDKDIWKAKGRGFDVYTSSGGLADFDGPYPAFRPPVDFWSDTNFWAPEAHRYQDRWYLFATFKPKEGRRGTAVLKSKAGIRGPYAPWSEGPVTPPEWECLDGTLWVDPGNKPWLVFCHEWQQIGDGQICAVPLAEDLKQAAGKPRILFRASEAPWAYPLKGRDPGSYVTDGPFLWKTRAGGLLMLWSSFGEDGSYRIGAARSESGGLNGPWAQSEEPLYSADGGHGMIFRGRDGVLYLAIHTPNKTPFERPLFVEVIEQDNGLAIKGSV